MYSCTPSLTSALDGVSGHGHISAALFPEKIRYLLYSRLGGSQGRSGEAREISQQPGFDLRPCSPQRVVIPTTISLLPN
jgi:hypothetical protein